MWWRFGSALFGFGLVWFWFGLVRFGLVCSKFDLVWSGLAQCETVRCGTVRCGTAWHGTARYGKVKDGTAVVPYETVPSTSPMQNNETVGKNTGFEYFRSLTGKVKRPGVVRRALEKAPPLDVIVQVVWLLSLLGRAERNQAAGQQGDI